MIDLIVEYLFDNNNNNNEIIELTTFFESVFK